MVFFFKTRSGSQVPGVAAVSSIFQGVSCMPQRMKLFVYRTWVLHVLQLLDSEYVAPPRYLPHFFSEGGLVPCDI